MRQYKSLEDAILQTGHDLFKDGKTIKSEKWQSQEVDIEMVELFGDVSFVAPLVYYNSELVQQTKADLPWAEDQFQERISGLPLNPGETYKTWPYYREDEKWRADGQIFSHTYMERIWPKYAETGGFVRGVDEIYDVPNSGLRFKLGDLNDVISLLIANPTTRQAYLPIWFPEDTGVTHGDRVPCTLGYLFNIREGFFHCTYYIRSCDYLRHFNNDVYLTNRMAIHVMTQVSLLSGKALEPGNMYFHCQSMHIFQNDMYALKRRLKI